VPIPAQSPNCSPHAKRLVKTIRSECLDQFVTFRERHLQHLLREFCADYLTGRYHQGIGGRIIKPSASPSNDTAMLGPILPLARRLRVACNRTDTAYFTSTAS
jgi:hypothetical protein